MTTCRYKTCTNTARWLVTDHMSNLSQVCGVHLHTVMNRIGRGGKLSMVQEVVSRVPGQKVMEG